MPSNHYLKRPIRKMTARSYSVTIFKQQKNDIGIVKIISTMEKSVANISIKFENPSGAGGKQKQRKSNEFNRNVIAITILVGYFVILYLFSHETMYSEFMEMQIRLIIIMLSSRSLLLYNCSKQSNEYMHGIQQWTHYSAWKLDFQIEKKNK